MKVAALYVDPRGPYFGRPDVEPWEASHLPLFEPRPRDARDYAGPWPVVAHPPCSAWSRLAPINQARYGHPIGADGGCFRAALASVRAWGGVLEHPAGSRAWAVFGLPRPTRGAWTRHGPEWVCEVSQRAYGHRARKDTWLLFSGITPPADLDWSRPAPVATVSFLRNHGGGDLPRLSKTEAKVTPPPVRGGALEPREERPRVTCPVCHGPAVEPPSPDRVPVLVGGALVPYTARRCARCPRVFYAPEEVKP